MILIVRITKKLSQRAICKLNQPYLRRFISALAVRQDTAFWLNFVCTKFLLYGWFFLSPKSFRLVLFGGPIAFGRYKEKTRPLSESLRSKLSQKGDVFSMAGVAGFEPTHAGVRIQSLTAWRHPKSNYYIITSGYNLSIITMLFYLFVTNIGECN